MKFHKILITGFSHENLDEKVWNQIKGFCDSLVFEPAADVDGLLCRFNKVDKQLIDQFPQLKYIGVLATGYGTVDTEYAKSKNIVVSNIPGYCTQSVGEYVFAIILEHLRQLEKAKQVVPLLRELAKQKNLTYKETSELISNIVNRLTIE